MTLLALVQTYDVYSSIGKRLITQGSVGEVITWSQHVGQWTPMAESNITEEGSSHLDDPSRTATRKCEVLMASKWKFGAWCAGLSGDCSLLLVSSSDKKQEIYSHL